METKITLEQQEKNKQTILKFYKEVMLNSNKEVAKETMLESYIQHNPQAADGIDALLEHVKDLDRDYPNRQYEFKHLFADGEFVITHIHFKLKPNELECMGCDIFRFEGDMIAEHWDVIQIMPETSLNDNGMY